MSAFLRFYEAEKRKFVSEMQDSFCPCLDDLAKTWSINSIKGYHNQTYSNGIVKAPFSFPQFQLQ